MKENVIKATIAALATGMGLYFKALFLPVALLILVMAADYTTGMIKAWILKELHSRVGTVGIVKKVCYLLVVGCGVLVDWILQGTLLQAGISYNVTFAFGMLVCVWLIINEILSVLENLSAIGVPMPAFLTKITGGLKVTIENAAKAEDE